MCPDSFYLIENQVKKSGRQDSNTMPDAAEGGLVVPDAVGHTKSRL